MKMVWHERTDKITSDVNRAIYMTLQYTGTCTDNYNNIKKLSKILFFNVIFWKDKSS